MFVLPSLIFAEKNLVSMIRERRGWDDGDGIELIGGETVGAELLGG